MCCRGSKHDKGFKITSTIYDLLRRQRSAYLQTLKGQNSPMFGKKTGRTSADFTNDWKEKISAANKGRVAWNKGVPRTEDEKAKMSATRKAKAKAKAKAADPTWNWNVRPKCSPEKAQKIKEANTGKSGFIN
jgi:hypothetical protein